jgi:predicted amidohydrolase YtcJ
MIAPATDLVILDARIWSPGIAAPRAAAIGIANGRIVAIGSNADVLASRRPGARVVEGLGRFLMPGFNDAHVHLMGGGAQLDSVQLKDAETPDEFARRIAERARLGGAGEWITGGEWDEQQWPVPSLPTRHLIDGHTANVPVFITRYDWHMALANTAALRYAGITAQTPDPAGGLIVRDRDGVPTGVLRDAAMDLVARVMPVPTSAQRDRTLRRALAHMASLGVTSVQDMGPDPADVETYRAFAARGDLTTRIRAVPLEIPLFNALEKQASATPPRSEPDSTLRVSGAKGFADGSLGSTTAYFFDPYTDAPDTSGLLSQEMLPLDEMRRRLVALDAAGVQLCIHAIGDRAISMVLDLFADVERANGRRARRPRIEHSQHVRPADFRRYHDLGVIASVQPFHAIDDGKWAEKRIGSERVKQAFPLQAFLDHRVPLACGTDWPVSPLDPLGAVYAAVTRATLDGMHPGGWIPEQRLSVADTLEAYTRGSAYAEFLEREKGAIEIGMLADVILLDRDPFAVAPEELRDLRVEMTVMGGRVTHEHER